MAFHISILVKFKPTWWHLLRQSLCRCYWSPTESRKWSGNCHWNQVTRSLVPALNLWYSQYNLAM